MKVNDYLKWIATGVTLTFSVMTALQMTPYNIYVANLSSLLWVIWALRIREWSLVTVNIGMLLIYFGGLFYHV